MKKLQDFLKRFTPFSYLFLTALVLYVLQFLFDRLFGDGDGKIHVLKFSTLLAFYTLGLVMYFFAWIIFLGFARLLKKEPSLKEFTFAWIPLLFILALLEVVFRFVPNKCAGPGVPDIVKQVYHPDNINRAWESASGLEQLNQHGFRGREFIFEKSPDDFVLLVLGGSTASGAYAAEFENVPANALEKLLAPVVAEKTGKKLKVFSLAEPAADIEDEIFWLFKTGMDLHPDAVVSLTGFNNMFHALTDPRWNFSSGARGFRRPGIKVEQNIGLDKVRLDFMAFLDNKLNKYSATYRFFSCGMKQAQKDPLRAEFDVKFSSSVSIPRCEQAAAKFVSAVNALKDFCDQKHVGLFVVLQPFATCGPKELQSSAASSTYNQEQIIYRILEGKVNSDLNSSIPLLNASVSCGNRLDSLQLFVDSCHLKDEGFILLNNSVADFLKSKL